MTRKLSMHICMCVCLVEWDKDRKGKDRKEYDLKT